MYIMNGKDILDSSLASSESEVFIMKYRPKLGLIDHFLINGLPAFSKLSCNVSSIEVTRSSPILNAVAHLSHRAGSTKIKKLISGN